MQVRKATKMGWTDQRNKQNQQTATGYSIAKAMGSWLLVNDDFSADSALCWLCFCWRRHALLDPNTEVLQVSSRALHPCLSAKMMEAVSIIFDSDSGYARGVEDTQRNLCKKMTIHCMHYFILYSFSHAVSRMRRRTVFQSVRTSHWPNGKW